jgi:hypothetical protein
MKPIIYKYLLPPPDETGEFSLQLPRGARVLSVQVQVEQPVLWALVDLDERMLAPREFYVVYTGRVLPPGDLEYIGTFQMYGGHIVLHLFEKRYVQEGP